MRPFGGRLTPGFADMPEVFLCVYCGDSVDLRLAVGEALIHKAAIRRRAEGARRYVEAVNGNGHYTNGNATFKQRFARALIRVLDRVAEGA